MASLKCKNCKRQLSFVDVDIVKCPSPNCQLVQETGLSKELHKSIEADCSYLQYPKFAVGRAIAYCSAIYGMATHAETFDPSKIEKHLKDSGERGVVGQTELEVAGDRAYRGMRDSQCGYMITKVTTKDKRLQQIYIVFRGSRSDEAGGKDNPMGAGFSQDRQGRLQNVDYAANFTGRQDQPWWCAGVKIRRGFYELYRSMSSEIVLNVQRLLGELPKARVIVTGHSLGAGLAVTCAHHLQHHLGNAIPGGGPFCYPFCTPRVGDLAFAREFKTSVANEVLDLPGEPQKAHYRRCINFVMDNDPVSWKAEKGYKHDTSDDPQSQGTRAAAKSFLGKVKYGFTKKEDPTIIFYQTPNVYKIGWYALWNVHQYTTVQEKILGKAHYKR
jgi:hypothetical protein